MTDYRCARGRRCAGAEKLADGQLAGQLAGAAIETRDGLCAACERTIERHLFDLPRLYTALEMIIGEHDSSGVVGPVSGTREPPIPPRVDVLTIQASIDTTAATWAAPVARRVRSPWDAAGVTRLRTGPRLTRASRLLGYHLDAWLRLPVARFRTYTPYGPMIIRRSGLEGALELFALSETGWRRVTGGSGHARLPVPCPHCEGELIRRNGSDQVDCTSCPARWPESDYRRLCLVVADSLQPA